MKTAIVILNWNTENFLGKFMPILLDSIKDIDGAEVIVADNDSSDGSLQLMKDRFPHVKTIAFDNNLGFTGGYNRAFEEIVTKAGTDAPEYFLLLNSDIEVKKGWLEPLIEWMDSHPECGACAPKLHSWSDRDMFEYAGAAGGYIDSFGFPFCRGRIMKRIEQDSGQFDHMNPDVFWASGACLMVRSRVYEQLGGLDSRFFAHMEEIDLCWRMQLAGYTICIVPESVVYHVGGGTLPSNSPFKLFLNYRNNLLMLDNNLSRTFALKHFKEGEDASRAAELGLAEAEDIIKIRRLIDLASAAVYLVTFRFKAFSAVLRAHRQYRQMRRNDGPEVIASYLNSGVKGEVRHIYGAWIVGKAILYRDKIFDIIHERDFFKF